VEADLVAALRRVLRSLLVNQQCSAPQAACRLRLHPRTLHRRLQTEGTSFQREFDAIRYAVAREFLADTAMPLAKIAEALDYADNTAFSRAFKRWSGVTPARWRKEGAKG
jgi:AraC-like DNA-binding protein